jgi:phosphoserine phosphatase RsbU/P
VARTTHSEKAATTAAPEDFGAVNLVLEVEDLSSVLAAQVEPKAIVRTLVTRLVERYSVALAGVWVTDHATSTLQLSAQAGPLHPPSGLEKATLDGTLLGKAVRERRPQLLNKQDSDGKECRGWARQNHLGFVAAFPLSYNSDVQGAVLVARPKPPSKTLLALFRLHARLVAIALRDAELIFSTRQTLSKLNILVEASKALTSTLDLPELLGRILDVAKTQTRAERGTLFLVDERTQEIWSLIAHGLEKQEIRLPIGKGIAGHVAKTGDIVNIPEAYADPRFNPEVDKRTGFKTRNILCLPIYNKRSKIIATLQLLNKEGGAFTDEDSDFLLTLSGHMALALENAQLHQQLLDKERMEKELALARGIQHSLLPDSAPVVEGFDIAVLNEPCYAVGGDYYDFLSLGPRTLLSVVADVEGKGVASALVMSNLQATLRALVLHLHSLNEIAESLNRMIWNDTRAEKYLSLFMGLLDTRHKAVHYINCGHVPPIVIRPGHDPITLTEGGMVIGLFENPPYQRGQVRLQTGDVVVLCTDGITESMNSQFEEYGAERLAKKVAEVADRKASEIVAAVRDDVEVYSRNGTHVDDKVMIAIKVS